LGQQCGTFVEECLIEADADMLEHADGDDALVAAFDVAVIGEPKIDVLSKPAFAGAAACRLELLPRQGDSGHVCAAEFGEVERKAAPAAPDVEYPVIAAHQELCREVALL